MRDLLFTNIISGNISGFLKSEGFSLKADTFSRESEGITQLINFQKSTKSTKDEIIFTTNVGFHLNIITEFKKGKSIKHPEINDCQWRIRAGILLGDTKDKWWSLRADTSNERIEDEIQAFLEMKTIPLIHRFQTYDSFIDFWSEGKNQGTTDFERIVNLAVLLKNKGELDKLSEIIQELKSMSEGKPFGSVAQIFIEKLSL